MASHPDDQLLVPSVLDRLLDDDPSNRREAPRSRGQMLRELKQSVRRDLENLLNTRCRVTHWPEYLDSELNRSLANYGLPDLAALDAGSLNRRYDYEKTLREIIERFEPRLRKVKVTLASRDEPSDRVLRFRIQAELHVAPFSEPVSFQSRLEPTTGGVQVEGEGG